MSGDPGSNVAKAIPNSLIKRQLVSSAGKAFLVADGKLKRTDDHEVSFAFEIAPFGKDLRNPRVFWTGPISMIKVTESDILKGGSEIISFAWSTDPMEVLFPQNQFVSAWGDGIDWIKKGYIQMSPQPTEIEAYLADHSKSWCFRFVVVAEGYDTFRIVLETVPTTLEVLKGCPWAQSLVTGGCELDCWKATTTQVLPSEYGPGILPFLHDTRIPKYEKESLLPDSPTIRHSVWEAVSLMGTSQALEDEEMVAYNPSKKRRPPSFPEIALVEEGKGCSLKRKASDQDDSPSPPSKTGNITRMKELLTGFLGGSVSQDELIAMGFSAGGGASKDTLVNVDKDKDETAMAKAAFDTPASINMDVTGFMSKLPPGIERNHVRHMTFKDINTAMMLSENMGMEDRTEALYRSVTETKVIPECEDNRKDKLHPARYFPDSMAPPEVYWSEVPTRVDPHVTGIPLAHVGLENEVAPLAIEKAGDKTKRLYIKYFLQSNVNVQQKQPKFKTQRGQDGAMGLSLDENWQEAQKVSEIQDAVFSYVFVMAHLHPRDFGPRNLLRLLHKLDWLSFRKDQIFALKLVIDGVLGRYHYLACQKKNPLYYKELQNFVTVTLEARGGPTKPADVSLIRLARDGYGSGRDFASNDGRDMFSNGGRGGGSARGVRGGRGAPSASAGYLASASRSAPESLPLCHQFNSQAGCPREASGRRCTLNNGKFLLHLCNKTDAKGEECLAAHARPNHK